MQDTSLKITILLLACLNVLWYVKDLHQSDLNDFFIEELQSVNTRLDNIARQYNFNIEGDIR